MTAEVKHARDVIVKVMYGPEELDELEVISEDYEYFWLPKSWTGELDRRSIYLRKISAGTRFYAGCSKGHTRARSRFRLMKSLSCCNRT